MASGLNHNLAVQGNGAVLAWGTGAGTNVPAGLSNAVAVAAGYDYSLALQADGRVLAWGSGISTNLPSGLTNVTAVAVSGIASSPRFNLATRANGTVVVWGYNSFDQTNPPAALSNLVAVAVGASLHHALVLANDGRPVIIHPPIGLTAYTGRDVTLCGDAVGVQPLSYQWRLNGANLPDATNTSLVIPNIQLVSTGNYQLFVSNAVSTALSLPALLNVISNKSLTFLSQITASATNVYQAGKVTFGGMTVLGSGPLRYQWFFSPTDRNYSAVPTATNESLALDPALAVQSGNYYLAVSNQSFGLTSAPVAVRVQFVKAWGYQSVSNPPGNVTNAIAIATGGVAGSTVGHYLALGADGKITAWGVVSAGFFTTAYETNVAALSNSFVTAIAARPQHSLALKSDGTVYAWGSGATNPPGGLNTVVAIACGESHDLALKADGSITGWPSFTTIGIGPLRTDYGQATNYFAATNVVAIAAGNQHSVVLRSDGSVVAWGYNNLGQTIVPPAAANVVAIAAGNGFSAALRANGTVVEWGAGIANYPVPAGLSNVVAISAASTHCTVLRNDGTVVSWGYEYMGNASNNVPSDLANVIAITSGGDHDFALFGTRAPAFTIQPWNRTVPFSLGKVNSNVVLCAKCAGLQPVTYQWRLNGTNIAGATNDSLTVRYDLAFNQVPAGGTYQLVASNAYGVALSKPAKVTLVIPPAEALDTLESQWGTSLYNWLTAGNAQWYGQTNITHDGVDAARSGGIGALQETILQTTVGTNWSGRYTFWWKISSEQFFDVLEFHVNGVVQTSISGEVDWQQVSVPVAAGTNVLQWRYAKDVSYDAGQDAGWVDQFAYVLDGPLITLQPVSQIVNMGTNVTF